MTQGDSVTRYQRIVLRGKTSKLMVFGLSGYIYIYMNHLFRYIYIYMYIYVYSIHLHIYIYIYTHSVYQLLQQHLKRKLQPPPRPRQTARLPSLDLTPSPARLLFSLLSSPLFPFGVLANRVFSAPKDFYRARLRYLLGRKDL